MDISAGMLVGVFDRVGIVAFAYSGVAIGMRRQLDIFGLVVLGVVTCLGGGVIRDLLLNSTPLMLIREDYLVLAVASSAAAIPLIARSRMPVDGVLLLCRAVGLGAFASAGALAAISSDLTLPAVLILAVVTATGGGVIRDVLADDVPAVLRAEINATAALCGGAAVWLLHRFDPAWASLAGAVLVASGVVAAGRFGLQLPHPEPRSDDIVE
ncbi:MAG: trimeric intracellular cation channel family protein [Dehalococcoidia bacterium]